MQVRNVFVSLTRFLHRGQLRRWIFRQHLRKRYHLRSQLASIRQHLVGLQNIISRQRIKPRRDAQAIVIGKSGAAPGQQLLGGERRQQRLDLLFPGVYQKAIRLHVLIDAEITPFCGGQLLQKIRRNARTLQQRTIRPRRMPIHSAQQNTLFLVSTHAELRVEQVGVRPELQRHAQNLKNVSAHRAARPLRVVDKRR